MKSLFVPGLLLIAAVAGAEEGLSTRGVLLSKKPSATYKLFLHRDGRSAEVPNNYEFRSGDKFAVRVKMNEGTGYLYVLNRTITGEPERIRTSAVRGIQLASNGRPTEVTAEEEEKLLTNESAAASEYRLVYPATHRKASREWVTVPANDLFEMDDNPGLEQLLVIVSPRPLTDFTKTLESLTKASTRTERMRAQQAIRGELAQMAANTESADPPLDARSITVGDLPKQQPSGPPVPPAPPKPNPGAAAPIQASRPYLVQLTLIHL